jgi:hypothetical protein
MKFLATVASVVSERDFGGDSGGGSVGLRGVGLLFAADVQSGTHDFRPRIFRHSREGGNPSPVLSATGNVFLQCRFR